MRQCEKQYKIRDSRKKVAVSKLIQIQKFKLTFINEVIDSHYSSQTKSKLQYEKYKDQNLPTTIKMGTRECIKCSGMGKILRRGFPQELL